MAKNLTNISVKVAKSGAKVKGGPSLNNQTTVVIASATNLADAETQAAAQVPGSVAQKATLPIFLGSGEGDKR